ncbi:MAG TPA: DUF2935 domain-containing protein [Epulopiscium sp.]|nr:DUF2935 domain-containing protein [Candidatus Epulonipiscium sp.]
MLSSVEFVRQSLELHLFSLRVMKEHAFFLEIGFTPKDKALTQQADAYRLEFDKLLAEVISLSNGIISPQVVKSEEILTPYTLQAEMKSTYFTGVNINTNLTKAEQRLKSGVIKSCNPMLEKQVSRLNNNAISLVTNLIAFKSKVWSDSLSCQIFTCNYPSLLAHIIEEAKFYLSAIQDLQKCKNTTFTPPIYAQMLFWNHVMGDHAKIIRGLLDPSEKDLIAGAESFAKEFETLTIQLRRAIEKELPTTLIIRDITSATEEIRDFKQQATQGILECKIQSIIIPLLGDHVLREANHYLRVLKTIC